MNLPTDLLFYIVAGAAVILVGLAKGGFAGLGAAAIPLLALVMDPVAAAGMLLPILIVQDAVSVWAFRHSYDARTLLLTLPGAVVGIFMGWYLASVIPADAVRGFVGVIALAFGTYRLLPLFGRSVGLSGPAPEWIGTIMGGVAGFTSQIAHAGGPPFQIWATAPLASGDLPSGDVPRFLRCRSYPPEHAEAVSYPIAGAPIRGHGNAA